MFFRIKLFTLVLLAAALSFKVKGQPLFSEAFEEPFPTPGWTFQHLGGGIGWQQNYYPNTGTNGSNSIVCSSNAYYGSNDWAYSPAVTLAAGKLYRVSYWYRCSIFGGSTERMKVTIGQGTSVAAQTTIHDYPALNNTVFMEGIDTVTVPVDGSYNLAFNYYSAPDQNVINLDSVVISELIPPPCSGIPVVGVATAPPMATSGNSFMLSLSGKYQIPAGLQIQWQTSLAGQNNFQNLSGGNTLQFVTTQTVNRDYRCLVTCTNGNTSAASNIVSVKMADAGTPFREKYIGNTGGIITGMSFLTAATGFVAFTREIGFTQDSGKTYVKRPITINNTNYNGYAVNLTFGFSVQGVHAIAADSLLVYGDYGAGPAILFSANQGLTWKLVFHQLFAVFPDIGNSISDMKFYTKTDGIAVNMKYILQTNDQGQSWTILYHMDPFYSTSRFTKISVPSSNVFYVAAGDYIFKRFGPYVFGAPVPATTGLDYNTVSFVSETTGYITNDHNSAVYKTTNGGDSWTKMNDPATSPVYASDLHFINDSTGFAAAKEGYNVLKTTDNGVTWEYCSKNSTYQLFYNGFSRLFFLNDQTAWAGGKGEYLMLTTSGGSPTIPKALFTIDTSLLTPTGKVNLLSASKSYYQHKWYKNGILISNNYNTDYIHDITVTDDTITLVISNGTYSDTMVQYQHFVYTLPPAITSFTPSSVAPNGVVTITGIGFINTSSVTFGGAEAAAFTVNSNSSITAIAGGGLSGDVVVTTPNGSDTAAGFTLLLPAKPAIATVTPAYGPVGTTVTITGSNFNPAAAQNIVRFGKVRAVVISATAGEIICKVPAGASFSPITVINLGTRLAAAAAKQFAVTFESHNVVEPGSFKRAFVIPPPKIQGVAVYPWHMTISDIDADGKNDLLVAMRYVNINDSVFVYRNTTTLNKFSFEDKLWLANGSSSVAADINNDGMLDVIVGNKAGSISILINAGSPGGKLSFKEPVNVPGFNGVSNLWADDLNGDGRADLMIAGFDEQAVGVLQNTSINNAISFANLVRLYPGGSPRSVTTADLDGDGKKELIAVANGNSLPPFTVIYKNLGTSGVLSFAPAAKLGNYSGAERVFAADTDNDDKQDIVTANDPNTGINIDFSVYPNSSAGGNLSFQPRLDFNNTGYQYALTGEMDNITGDSLVDYIASNYSDHFYSVYKNISAAGNTNFDPPVTFGPYSGFQTTICSADLDGDGKPDLNSTQFTGIEIYKNKIEDPVEVSLCPPADIFSVTSNVQGASYQWQQNTGTGFVNLADNALVTGSQTNQLTIANAPTYYAGYQYRCIADGKLSSVLVIKFSNTFFRDYDRDWNNYANWSCGSVPDKYTDVIIGVNTGVDVNSNVEVRSLQVSPFSNITVNPGFTLKVNH